MIQSMIFDQSEYNVRCEWGGQGVAMLAPISDVVIIVDILSFSTAVEIAANQSAVVFPYRWKDETAYEFAKSVDAEVAYKGNLNNYRSEERRVGKECRSRSAADSYQIKRRRQKVLCTAKKID